jgi:hypothetical protein
MKHLKGDHDEHVQTWDEQKWKDWPAAEEAHSEPEAVTPVVTDGYYVFAKSDSVEHLYWGDGTSGELWVSLEHAFAYSRLDMEAEREPADEGFWMTLDRAMELEK